MSLLAHEPIFEVVVTMDTAGATKCTHSTLDADAPVERIVEALLKSAAMLSEQADRVAAQAHLAVTVDQATGTITIAPQ